MPTSNAVVFVANVKRLYYTVERGSFCTQAPACVLESVCLSDLETGVGVVGYGARLNDE